MQRQPQTPRGLDSYKQGNGQDDWDDPENPENPGEQDKQRMPLRPKMRRDRETVTPFGEVLTDYMSRQRPIWTTGKLGAKLGIRRQTVANWIYHDITPPIEVMLEVLAKLNIPISVMVEAYQRRGVPTPVLAPPETMRELAGEAGPRSRQPSEEEIRRDWHDMLEQTRAVMLATGFPRQALDTLLATIEERRDIAQTFSAHIAREHMEQPEGRGERQLGLPFNTPDENRER